MSSDRFEPNMSSDIFDPNMSSDIFEPNMSSDIFDQVVPPQCGLTLCPRTYSDLFTILAASMISKIPWPRGAPGASWGLLEAS